MCRPVWLGLAAHRERAAIWNTLVVDGTQPGLSRTILGDWWGSATVYPTHKLCLCVPVDDFDSMTGRYRMSDRGCRVVPELLQQCSDKSARYETAMNSAGPFPDLPDLRCRVFRRLSLSGRLFAFHSIFALNHIRQTLRRPASHRTHTLQG